MGQETWINCILFDWIGGMLLVKLDHTDLQSENMTKFDGAMVYAQNKRQQVVMTERWANRFPNIYFASMHPGESTFIL